MGKYDIEIIDGYANDVCPTVECETLKAAVEWLRLHAFVLKPVTITGAMDGAACQAMIWHQGETVPMVEIHRAWNRLKNPFKRGMVVRHLQQKTEAGDGTIVGVHGRVCSIIWHGGGCEADYDMDVLFWTGRTNQELIDDEDRRLELGTELLKSPPGTPAEEIIRRVDERRAAARAAQDKSAE